MIASGFSLVRTAVGVVALVIVISGFAYDHSHGFKEQCGAHKLSGESMGTFKNLVCDADFTLK